MENLINDDLNPSSSDSGSDEFHNESDKNLIMDLKMNLRIRVIINMLKIEIAFQWFFNIMDLKCKLSFSDTLLYL